MRYPIVLTLLFICLFAEISIDSSTAQDTGDYGVILDISDKTITVQFEQRTLKLGDEIMFTRYREIVDPVSGRVRGGQEREIGQGIVEDLGLEKAYVTLLSLSPGISSLLLTDRPVFTGQEKEFTRTSTVYGRIQTLISDEEIEIDVGTSDQISEGDFFLIQRTENIYDPETNEVTDIETVEIGRGTVNKVAENTSTGELLLNPGMKLNIETDDVVFEPPAMKSAPVVSISPSIADSLQREIDRLKIDVRKLRASLDSLGLEHLADRNEFQTLRREIETVISGLTRSDIAGSGIVIKNEEPITPSVSQDLFDSYKQALDNCLDHKFDEALAQFQSIINRYPASKLVENCRYWIAQSYFSMKEYDAAARGFSAVLEDERFVHKDDDASIMLGITHYLTGNNAGALTEFRKFILSYPESEYRDKVTYWIERLS